MKIYAELTGNRKKRGIKSPCDNNCEGRCIYDCFVLNEKSNAIYYHGAQGVLKTLDVLTAPGATGKTKVIVTPATEGTNTWVYKTGTAPTAVTYGTALTAPADPTRAADGSYTYKFAGWSTDGKTVIALPETVTYTATYTAQRTRMISMIKTGLEDDHA